MHYAMETTQPETPATRQVLFEYVPFLVALSIFITHGHMAHCEEWTNAALVMEILVDSPSTLFVCLPLCVC